MEPGKWQRGSRLAEARVMATPPEAVPFTSLRNLAALCGALAGVGGVTHGIGQAIQGSRSAGGIVFGSWAQDESPPASGANPR
jgi:hypothetical protein